MSKQTYILGVEEDDSHIFTSYLIPIQMYLGGDSIW